MIGSDRARLAICFLALFLPMTIKRLLLNGLLGWKISRSASIGFSFVCVDRLEMGDKAKIGHLNVMRNFDRIALAECARIGGLNWINGVRSNGKLYPHQAGRRPCLELGRHASVTSRHLIDCSDAVTIGAFSTVAGARSQIVTHGIDVALNRQGTGAIEIGEYCYVGTASILLKGAKLPDCSILGAGSLLAKRYEESHHVYAGVPARPLKPLDRDSLFFTRDVGFVD